MMIAWPPSNPVARGAVAWAFVLVLFLATAAMRAWLETREERRRADWPDVRIVPISRALQRRRKIVERGGAA